MAQEQTPENVAKEATTAARIPNGLMLLGIFGSESAPEALLRLPNGKTSTVSRGDNIDGGTVTAIGEDRVALAQNGRAVMLRLPR